MLKALHQSNVTIVLGSKSPRRSELLSKAGIPFVKRLIEVEETYPPQMSPEEVPEYLSKLKASAFESELYPNELLICADTIVIQHNQVIGKPYDVTHAKQTLHALSGNWHTVVTGVCFKTQDKQHTFSQRSDVKFYPLSEEEINYYIETYKPFDKAGSYGVQDWIGINKIETINGSYTNIMGLPMGLLYHELIRFLKL